MTQHQYTSVCESLKALYRLNIIDWKDVAEWERLYDKYWSDRYYHW